MDTSSAVAFVQHSEFAHIVGQTPRATVLADAGEEGRALFHEACIYHKPSRSIFVTSNQVVFDSTKPNASTSDKQIRLFRIFDETTLEGKGTGDTSKSSSLAGKEQCSTVASTTDQAES